VQDVDNTNDTVRKRLDDLPDHVRRDISDFLSMSARLTGTPEATAAALADSIALTAMARTGPRC
jgi:hypothetical protein